MGDDSDTENEAMNDTTNSENDHALQDLLMAATTNTQQQTQRVQYHKDLLRQFGARNVDNEPSFNDSVDSQSALVIDGEYNPFC